MLFIAYILCMFLIEFSLSVLISASIIYIFRDSNSSTEYFFGAAVIFGFMNILYRNMLLNYCWLWFATRSLVFDRVDKRFVILVNFLISVFIACLVLFLMGFIFGAYEFIFTISPFLISMVITFFFRVFFQGGFLLGM